MTKLATAMCFQTQISLKPAVLFIDSTRLLAVLYESLDWEKPWQHWDWINIEEISLHGQTDLHCIYSEGRFLSTLCIHFTVEVIHNMKSILLIQSPGSTALTQNLPVFIIVLADIILYLFFIVLPLYRSNCSNLLTGFIICLSQESENNSDAINTEEASGVLIRLHHLWIITEQK